MPLPPLPDAAVINGAGHISDSNKLEAYLKALADQDKIPLDVLPDPDPGQPGHVAWHNAMIKNTTTVATALGIKVTLPPLDVKAGDLSHVTHHNLLTKALDDLTKSIPFTVTGGKVTESNGYRVHTFANPGKDVLTVKGSGTVQIIVAGGGGGHGYGFIQKVGEESNTFCGGGGGGGTLWGITRESDPIPTIKLTDGLYNLVVGAHGKNSDYPNSPGATAEASSFIGQDVSINALGGGGGGSCDTNALSGGSGGGGGAFIDAGSRSVTKATSGGKGNPGGNGMDGATSGSTTPAGGGGGSCGDAVSVPISSVNVNAGGPGWSPSGLTHICHAMDAAGYDDSSDFGHGGASYFEYISDTQGPAGGGFWVAGRAENEARNGIVMVAYKISNNLWR